MFSNKLLSNLIEIVPIKESFFFQTKLEKKIKLNSDLIKLNYSRYSPIKNANTLYVAEGKNLYFWFYKKEISKPIIIPQAFIIYSFYKKKYDNSLIIIEDIGIHYIMIIKESILLSVFSTELIDNKLIDKMLNEYNLSSTVTIKKDEYQMSNSDFLKSLSYGEILKWNRFHIDKKELLQHAINKLSYPISFLLLFSMGIHIYHTNKLKTELEILEKQYLHAKNSNSEAKEKLKIESDHKKKWLEFAKNEFPYANNISILNRIHKTFTDKKAKLKSFSIMGSKFKLKIETKDDFILYLNILNKIEMLKHVTIKNVDRKRNTALYEATIIPTKLEKK